MFQNRTQIQLATLIFSLFSFLTPVATRAQEAISQINVTNNFGGSRDWSLSYFNFSSASAELTEQGATSWNLYQYIAWNYRLDYSKRFGARVAFNTQTPGTYDRRGNVRNLETKASDVHFVYSDYNLAEFPYEWDLTGSFYLYLPTSESSQQKKWITRTRAWFNFEKKLNRKTLFAVSFRPEYYFNSQKSYRRETFNTAADGRTFHSVRANNNTLGSLDSSLSASYALSKTFSPQLSIGLNQIWMEQSEHITEQPSYRDSFNLELASWITINRQLRFLAGYSNDVGLTNRFFPEQQFQLMRPSESQFFVMTFWSLL